MTALAGSSGTSLRPGLQGDSAGDEAEVAAV